MNRLIPLLLALHTALTSGLHDDAFACGSCCNYCNRWCTGSICTSNDGYYSNMQSCEGCADKRAAEYDAAQAEAAQAEADQAEADQADADKADAVQEADDYYYDDDYNTTGASMPFTFYSVVVMVVIFFLCFFASLCRQGAAFTGTHSEGSAIVFGNQLNINGDVSGHLWALFAVTLKMDVYQPKVRTIRYLKTFNLSFKIYIPNCTLMLPSPPLSLVRQHTDGLYSDAMP